MAYKTTTMKDVYVNLGKDSYHIIIDKGALNQIGHLLSETISPCKTVIVTDKTVGPLYGNAVSDNLSECDFDVKLVSIEPGEDQKTLSRAEELYEVLFGHKMDRKSLIIAIGGGVVGDLTGFVASTFMRGIPFVQIPTTLLAQVDSSIGGKVAVNHPLGKNMIGSFYQPKAVFIDTDTLGTLPKAEIIAGMAEVIKYGMIKDPDFFEFIEEHLFEIVELDSDVLEKIIYNSCKIKAQVVELDEKEEGLRAILNYGHTIGHALEALTSYKKYRHGEAVAMGMIYASKIAMKMGLIDNTVLERQESLLTRLGLKLMDNEIKPDDIVKILYQDKKAIGGKSRFVLPTGIGSVTITDKANDEIVLDVLNSG